MADKLRTTMSADCIFCQILAGDLPSAEVYGDDVAYAFADISPVTQTHVLVIPRDHVTFIESTSEEHEPLLGHLLRVGATVARQCGSQTTATVWWSIKALTPARWSTTCTSTSSAAA